MTDPTDFEPIKKAIVLAFGAIRRPVPAIGQSEVCLNILFAGRDRHIWSDGYQIWDENGVWAVAYSTDAVRVFAQSDKPDDIATELVLHYIKVLVRYTFALNEPWQSEYAKWENFHGVKLAISLAYATAIRTPPATKIEGDVLRISQRYVDPCRKWTIRRDDKTLYLSDDDANDVARSDAAEGIATALVIDDTKDIITTRFRQAARHVEPIIIEGDLLERHVSIEDGGQAMIGELDDDAEEGFFVRLQSWSEKKDHPVMQSLIGRRIRITVETID